MKKMLLIAAGLMLSIVTGCTAVDKVANVTEYVQTLKEKGCGGLSESSKRILVAVIKTKVAIYPSDGICNQDWVRDVLLDKLDLETPDVQNGSAQLGYKADSGHGPLDKPSTIALLLRDHESMGFSTSRLSYRSRIDSQTSSFVYAPCVIRNQSSRSHSRLHLYKSMRSVHQEASRSYLA